jgi:hypothetical protein
MTTKAARDAVAKSLTERRLVLTMRGWNKVDMDNLETYVRDMHIKGGRAEVISLEASSTDAETTLAELRAKVQARRIEHSQKAKAAKEVDTWKKEVASAFEDDWFIEILTPPTAHPEGETKA